MTRADIVQTCDRLSREVQDLEAGVRERDNAIREATREASRLESAKIGLRVEFGQENDPRRQAQLDAAIKDLNRQISDIAAEQRRLSKERGVLAYQLRQAVNAHRDFGCATLRRA